MATFEQGSAPAVLLDNGEIVWEFRGRKFETDDDAVKAMLEQHGAVRLDTAEDKKAPKGKQEAAAPEGFEGLTKPEVIAKVKELYGVELSANQSRADLMKEVAKTIETANAK